MLADPGRALPCDYDTHPNRWVNRPAEANAPGDVHELVAARILHERLGQVLDVGSGHGRLGDLLDESECAWVGIDSSPGQVARSQRPVILADANHLPFRSESFGAVAALWMLYHLADPATAVREAYRVLRPGGLFVASATRRDDSPEVEPPRAPTTFDAEEAPAIVGKVFDNVEVESWDAPMFTLPDHQAVHDYLASRMRDPALAEHVQTPVAVTKRGSLIWARKTQ